MPQRQYASRPVRMPGQGVFRPWLRERCSAVRPSVGSGRGAGRGGLRRHGFQRLHFGRREPVLDLARTFCRCQGVHPPSGGKVWAVSCRDQPRQKAWLDGEDGVLLEHRASLDPSSTVVVWRNRGSERPRAALGREHESAGFCLRTCHGALVLCRGNGAEHLCRRDPAAGRRVAANDFGRVRHVRQRRAGTHRLEHHLDRGGLDDHVGLRHGRRSGLRHR
mmetsp:Transcript_20688/g.57732  ORF Transcript_20688/g.57732 Transcript_20688/m.57732 type:complete len:220 (-) Transcript_20688:1442-2101(-)